MVRFDDSTGKPCSANQTKASGLCQEVRDDSVIPSWDFPLFSTDFSPKISKVHSYSVRQSEFSQSASYINFFYYPSTFFGTLLPFVLLSILNGFLIWTVRKSHKMRHAMTNTRQVIDLCFAFVPLFFFKICCHKIQKFHFQRMFQKKLKKKEQIVQERVDELFSVS